MNTHQTKKLIIKIIFLTLFLVLAGAKTSLAADEGWLDPIIFKSQVTIPGSEFIANATTTLESNTGPIARYISAIYNYGVGIVGIVAALMLMLGGVIWLTAAGSSTKIEQAKSIIISSLVGMALVLTAVILLKTINPELVAFKLIPIATVKEISALKVENCHWAISGENDLLEDISGCKSEEVSQDVAYCKSAPDKPSSSDLAEYTAQGYYTAKADCCCTVSKYGVEAQKTGSTVISLDNSGEYWCCTVTGDLTRMDGDDPWIQLSVTDSISFAIIESATQGPTFDACYQFLKDTTKTIDGVMYKYKDTTESTYDTTKGKCTYEFGDDDPLKTQCEGKPHGASCQANGSSSLGSGYCIGGYCKACLKAGDNCSDNNECANWSNMCGDQVDSGDCENTYPQGYWGPALPVCLGEVAGGDTIVGRPCSNNTECPPEFCCAYIPPSGSGGCFPLKQFPNYDPMHIGAMAFDNGLKCSSQ